MLHQIKSLDDFFELLGIIVFVIVVLNLTSTTLLKLITFPFRKKLIARYGENSWALITGASDGIGKAFCEELAKEGFNIILVARNKEKLQRVAGELKQLNPNIKTEVIVIDFKNAHMRETISSHLPHLKKFDISVIVNNVGLGYIKSFDDITEEEIYELISINVYSLVRLTKLLLPQLLERKTRSAIINVSSATGVRPMPQLSVYSATKAFGDFFSRALSIECPSIDILSLRPFTVSTPATLNKKLSFETISANDCARGTLNDLGYTRQTFGHWRHKVVGITVNMLPEWLFYLIVVPVLKKECERRNKAEKEQAKAKNE